LPDVLFIIIALILAKIFDLIFSANYDIYTNPFAVAIPILVLAIILFIIKARLDSFKLTLILEAINKKKSTIKKSYKSSKKFFSRVIYMKILTYLILLITFSIALIIFAFINIIQPVLATIVAIVLIFIVLLSIFFRNAVLFQEDKKVIPAIKKSLETFKNKKLYTFGTVVIILIINSLAALLNFLFPTKEISLILSQTISIIYLIIIIFISVWSNLFIFNTYKKIKTRKIKLKTKKKSKH